MQTKGVYYPFQDNATPREKVVITLMYPRQFVRWCRKHVGRAPNAACPCEHGCVMEVYLRAVTGVVTYVGVYQINIRNQIALPITTPTWVQRVVDRVDRVSPRSTYHDLANMLVEALDKGELA